MDSPSPSRQSGFSARNSSVDVSQLDKVNAIPNKAADNVLLSNLCQEDQHYLKFLMENDSSDSDEGPKATRHTPSGAWSPMVQSPMMSKRKGAKSSFAVTLSLEDISYIRPSWGISKGIRTIEVDSKKGKTKLEKSESSFKDVASAETTEANSGEITYKYFLILLTFVVVFLTLPPYWAEQKRTSYRVSLNRLQVSKKSRIMEIYRPDASHQPLGEPILRVEFGLGIPADLKAEEFTCDLYEAELGRRLNASSANNKEGYCFSCLDWAVRANQRVLVERQGETDICYDIKWQSYDSLATPLIDCFSADRNNQWFGLGDVQSSEWALDRLSFDWTPLATNLTVESLPNQLPSVAASTNSSGASLGSYANFTLFSTAGIFIGQLRSDFRLWVKVEQNTDDDGKRICIKASCNEKCGRVWSRADDLTEFRHSNNVLEYRICSSTSTKSLISNQVDQRVRSLDTLVRGQIREQVGELLSNDDRPIGLLASKAHQFERLIERESHLANWQQQQQPTVVTADSKTAQPASGHNSSTSRLLPEGIGLIERTIFSTSPEFMPVLDGKTLRQYVDSVVKMSLKTSLILLIDSRWQTHIGSLQLDTGSFPKWRLLLEIIHNKGFKVVLTVKPFVDTVIGQASINELFDGGKLYGISQGLNRLGQDARGSETIIRRKSLFSIANETIEIGQNGSTLRRPYVFKCKESQVGYCALLDLNSSPTRSWLIGQMGRSELLAPNAAVDGILVAGSHPDGFTWDDHYRQGVGELIRGLFFGERIFTLAQWTGDLGYIQLASRPFTWQGLRSVVNSVLNLGLEGFSLIHPGSVWGDLKGPSAGNGSALASPPLAPVSGGQMGRPQARKDPVHNLEHIEAEERSNEELCIRWLQVSVFLPILQFNNLAPIERYGLQDLLQDLVKLRKLFVIAELKRYLPFTPLISQSKLNSSGPMMPLIRPVWFNQQQHYQNAHLTAELSSESVVGEQFSIGPDILVAPVLAPATRQRDIYLPNGLWHDELRQVNIRGGKWLRNYPVELAEIAWFTRVRR